MAIMMNGSWYIKHDRQNFLSFWATFCLFTPLAIQKIKILKKWKSSWRYYYLHKCTINDNHMIYGPWDISYNRQIFFVIFGHFLPFYTPNSPKNENITKLKKTSGDIIILHKCTKNHDHRLNCSWDMVCAGCNCCFSFWTIFYPFTPLTAQKIKISKTWKKHLEISSFYTSVPKIMIKGYTIPKIWRMADVIFIFILGYFLPFYPPNSRKNENLKKIKKHLEIPSFYIFHDHMLYCSWDMTCAGSNCCFSFWAIFFPFILLTAQKNKISK